MDTIDFHPVSVAIERLLKEAGVWYERFVHEPVITSEEAALVRRGSGYTIAHGTKSLILRGKRPGMEKEYIMVVVSGGREFDKKKVKAETGYDDLRFASVEEVAHMTSGVVRGGVPPWGRMFGLPLFVDTHVFDNEKIIFNAGDRRVSIAMFATDYRQLASPLVYDLAV